MTSPLRSAVLGIRFASELALLAVLGLAGAGAGLGTAADVAIAVLAPVTAAAIWGIGIAPRARRRWPDPWRLGAEIVLFLAAAAALTAAGWLTWGIVFAVAAVAAIGIAVAVRLVAPGG